MPELPRRRRRSGRQTRQKEDRQEGRGVDSQGASRVSAVGALLRAAPGNRRTQPRKRVSDPAETPAATETPSVGPANDGSELGAAPVAAEAKGFGGKLLFWVPWPLLVAADLWSKHAVFAFMAARSHPGIPEVRRAPYEVFDGPIRFELVTWGNTGTIWGLFQDGTVPLMVLRCLALVGLLFFVRSTARKARLQLAVLSLVFAGAVGNLYDNFVR